MLCASRTEEDEFDIENRLIEVKVNGASNVGAGLKPAHEIKRSQRHAV